MNTNSRTLLVATVALWVLAAGLYGTLRLTYGQRSAYIHVRWAASVDDVERARIERTYTLTEGDLKEGRTWGYYLTDVSNANIRRLVGDPAVEDTHYIHRTAFRPWRSALRGDYPTSRPGWIAGLMELLMRASLFAGAAALAMGAFRTWRERRAGTAPAAAA